MVALIVILLFLFVAGVALISIWRQLLNSLVKQTTTYIREDKR